MTDPEVSPTIERVRARRERLGAAADDVERAVTRPAGDEAAWRDGLEVALAELRAALDDHVREVEGDDGLYAEIMERSPRLAHAIDRLRGDHTTLATEVGQLDTMVTSPNVTIDDVRERALALLTDLSRHRHRGADLIWDSYELDIGAGD